VKRKEISRREIKGKISQILRSEEPASVLDGIKKIKPSLAVNNLFSFLYDGNPVVKWNAVMSMGAVVSRLADEDMEAARTIIRRLMWNLNDESGGIGWGSPEAMGEILANNKKLADEYHKILLSYSRRDGNFQENEYMQEGVLWGIGRLASKRPDLVQEPAVPHLMIFLDSRNPVVRGYAARLMGIIGYREARQKLESLLEDITEIPVNMDRRPVTLKVRDMAAEALERIL
jgi:HEAT repeat protein